MFPASRLTLYGISLAAGLALLVLLGGVFKSGGKAVASPGPVQSNHASVETQCANCHAPSVADVRCERCHDPFGSNRFENTGHVWFGTKNPALVAKAPTVPCARCHSDHQGRKFRMIRVDERDCAGCHFRSMAKHPEFGLVKAGVMKDEGIHFTHKRHIEEMKKAKLEACQYCHEPTRDRKGFEMISYDRACARCHLNTPPTRTTDPMPRAAVVLPEEIDAPWATALAANVQRLPRDKVVWNNVQHKDPWILYNLWKLSREVDPAGLARRREILARRVDELAFQLREPPTKGLALASLREQEQSLDAQAKQVSRDPARLAERRRLEKALARVRVQIELGSPQMTAPRRRGRVELENDLRDRKAELADYDIAASSAVNLSEAERAARVAAVTAMTTQCAKCHIYDGPFMAQIKAALPVLAHARFNHLPHVQQKNCEFCHAMAKTSVKAENVNLPGVANCQGCHRPGRSQSECAECHYYHPRDEPWPPI
jgi:predicted CXXCH cytochrome family protein